MDQYCAQTNQYESLGAMLGVGPIHTISQQMSPLSVSRPMVTQVRRHVYVPLPQSPMAADTAYDITHRPSVCNFAGIW